MNGSTLTRMQPLRARVVPFLVALLVIAMVSLVMTQLPDSLVAQWRRQRPLDSEGSGWAYRLLSFFAVGMAAYGAFSVLRPERVKKEQAKMRGGALLQKGDLVRAVARTAALMIGLTMVYAVAAFAITGERGGFWLFVLIALLQAAWYYRQTGVVAQWIMAQPDAIDDPVARHSLAREPSDYVPPLARGLTPVQDGEPLEKSR